MNLFYWNVTAGDSSTWFGSGKYFRLLEGLGDVTIRVGYRSGDSLTSDLLIGVGVDLRHPVSGESFTSITFESDLTQKLRVLASDLPTTDSRLSGQIEIKPKSSFAGLPKMTATGTIAANSARSQLELSVDQASTGTVWLGGVVDKGIPLKGGGSYQIAFVGEMPILIVGTATLYIAEIF